MEKIFYDKKTFESLLDFKNNIRNDYSPATGYSHKELKKITNHTFPSGTLTFGARDKYNYVWAFIYFTEGTGYAVKTKEQTKPSYEESYPIIEKELNKNRYRWQLKATPWMDYDDVKQIIADHIYNKWHLYNYQVYPLAGWVGRIINNKIINLLRDVYYTHCKPCNNCKFFDKETEECQQFNDSMDCVLYKRWDKKKKHAHDVKMPLPLENHSQEVYERPDNGPDIDVTKGLAVLAKGLKEVLNDLEWDTFEMIYINHHSEKHTIEILGKKYKLEKKTQKYLREVQDSIIKKAKLVVRDGEVDFF